MAVGFINSGIMKLRQGVGIILGANLCTVITSWFLSLSGIKDDNAFLKLLKPTSFSDDSSFFSVDKNRVGLDKL